MNLTRTLFLISDGFTLRSMLKAMLKSKLEKWLKLEMISTISHKASTTNNELYQSKTPCSSFLTSQKLNMNKSTILSFPLSLILSSLLTSWLHMHQKKFRWKKQQSWNIINLWNNHQSLKIKIYQSKPILQTKKVKFRMIWILFHSIAMASTKPICNIRLNNSKSQWITSWNKSPHTKQKFQQIIIMEPKTDTFKKSTKILIKWN